MATQNLKEPQRKDCFMKNQLSKSLNPLKMTQSKKQSIQQKVDPEGSLKARKKLLDHKIAQIKEPEDIIKIARTLMRDPELKKAALQDVTAIYNNLNNG